MVTSQYKKSNAEITSCCCISQGITTSTTHFEKDGYAIFNNWADDSAKLIIDSEVSSLLKKSGVGTRDQGISTIAGYEQYKKLKTFNN